MSLNLMLLRSKRKNGLCKMVTKSWNLFFPNIFGKKFLILIYIIGSGRINNQWIPFIWKHWSFVSQSLSRLWSYESFGLCLFSLLFAAFLRFFTWKKEYWYLINTSIFKCGFSIGYGINQFGLGFSIGPNPK